MINYKEAQELWQLNREQFISATYNEISNKQEKPFENGVYMAEAMAQQPGYKDWYSFKGDNSMLEFARHLDHKYSDVLTWELTTLYSSKLDFDQEFETWCRQEKF